MAKSPFDLDEFEKRLSKSLDKKMLVAKTDGKLTVRDTMLLDRALEVMRLDHEMTKESLKELYSILRENAVLERRVLLLLEDSLKKDVEVKEKLKKAT